MRTEARAGFWARLAVGASLSLFTVGLSTLEELAGQPQAYERFSFLLLALASALTYLTGAFLALWAVAAVIGLRLPRWPAALTLAGFLPLCFYTLLMPSAGAYPLPLPWVDAPTRTLVLSAGLLGVLLLFALRPVNVYPLWSRALRLGAPAGLLSMALLFGVWMTLYGGDSRAWLFAAVAVVALLLSFRSGDGWKAAGAAGLLALVGIAAAAGFRGETAFEPIPRTAAPDGPNVILITIDTLRYDALFGPASERPETPALDAFAQQSYVFRKAYSAGPWTPPGITSLVTGVGPFVHGLGLAGRSLPAEIPTLADRMADAGYQVAAVGSNPYVRLAGLADRFPWAHWHPYRSYGQGFGSRVVKTAFDYYLWNPTTRQLTSWAADWLTRNRDAPFFFWLHYYDPHVPYDPPPELVDRKLEDPRVGAFVDWSTAHALRAGTPPVSAKGRRWIRHLYDAEVRYVDQNLERLFATLEELELFDDSWIVLTSDHGEEFFEHGGFEHGQSLYDELIHVPLLIKPPGGAGGSRQIERVVSTAAATPTILDLAGVRYDADDFSYPSLRPLFDGESETEGAPVFSTGVRFFENWRSILFDGSFQYIRRDVSGKEELYDLEADPQEQNRLDDPERTARGRELLERHIEAEQALRERYGVAGGGEQRMNESSRRLLESLGYIQ
ncbi:MAG: sulfatase [Acidobacteria bacterium]|nr:sulfatase [Acidobacteriota bacterium]